MAQNWSGWCWQLGLASSLAIGGAIAFSGDCAFAQITPDDTLGAESSLINKINELNERIDGGARRGANLFHSFQDFNIGEGRGAYFANPTGIENILTRVTGANRSNILGALGVLGNANLFLINPNGIIFGSNARLAIPGSFVASTASSIKFADGTAFSATAPQSAPLLTVSVPIGLQFGGNAGGIRVQGSGLEVQPGKTLALVGGDITLEGGERAALEKPEPNLKAPEGRIELGSVAGIGEVSLNQSGNSWILRYDSIDPFGNIRLEDKAFVDVTGEGGGNLQIQGARLELTQGSRIFADTEGAGVGGEVLVQTTQAIALSERSQITADVSKEAATGTGGDVTIKTRQLSIQGDDSRIRAGTFGKGQGGNLTVRASESIELVGTTTSGLFTQTRGAGDAGDLTITTGRLSVQNGAAVSTSTSSPSKEGQGGNLSVTALESVELVGRSGLFTQTQGAADAGDLTINTRRLSVQNGAVVASSLSTGKGGDLTVLASEVELIGTTADGRFPSGLFTQAQSTGAGGNLTITTGRLSVQNGAVVSTITSSPSKESQGGNLSVTALESVELVGRSGLFTQTQGAADAGDLTINTRRLSVQNGAVVSATTFGQGKGGDIRVNASDSVNLFGVGSNRSPSGLFTSTTGGGQGGNIFVDTRAFRVADNAVVDARTIGAGNGGNITVNANTFEAVNGGQILASAFSGSSGSAGNITVNATDITISGSAPFKRLVGIGGGRFVEDESASSGLFVLSRGLGDAGKIDVTARFLRLDNQGELTAESNSGQGGNISLQVQDLLQLGGGSKISTTAGNNQNGGNGGNIIINAKFIVASPLENSDITANAFTGNGGKVDIFAQGLFGIEFRERQTSLSDITASSELGVAGFVDINSPDVDPSRGLANLPVVPVEAEVVQACTPGERQAQSEFIITGRGGLPPTPSEALSNDAVEVDWVTLNPKAAEEQNVSPSSEGSYSQTVPAQIVEVQGWTVGSNGKVILTASASPVNPHSPCIR